MCNSSRVFKEGGALEIFKIGSLKMGFPAIWASYLFVVLVTLQDFLTLRC